MTIVKIINLKSSSNTNIINIHKFKIITFILFIVNQNVTKHY